MNKINDRKIIVQFDEQKMIEKKVDETTKSTNKNVHKDTKFYNSNCQILRIEMYTEQYDKTEQMKRNCILFRGLGSYSAMEF